MANGHGSVLDHTPIALDDLSTQQTASETILVDAEAQADYSSIDLGHTGAAALGTQLPQAANHVAGTGAVQAEISANILEKVADGRPAFRPELGQVSGRAQPAALQHITWLQGLPTLLGLSPGWLMPRAVLSQQA